MLSQSTESRAERAQRRAQAKEAALPVRRDDGQVKQRAKADGACATASQSSRPSAEAAAPPPVPPSRSHAALRSTLESTLTSLERAHGVAHDVEHLSAVNQQQNQHVTLDSVQQSPASKLLQLQNILAHFAEDRSRNGKRAEELVGEWLSRRTGLRTTKPVSTSKPQRTAVASYASSAARCGTALPRPQFPTSRNIRTRGVRMQQAAMLVGEDSATRDSPAIAVPQNSNQRSSQAYKADSAAASSKRNSTKVKRESDSGGKAGSSAKTRASRKLGARSTRFATTAHAPRSTVGASIGAAGVPIAKATSKQQTPYPQRRKPVQRKVKKERGLR